MFYSQKSLSDMTFMYDIHFEVWNFLFQSKRLIAERWGDFVKVEEYVPSDKLTLSFCRSSVSLARPQQNGISFKYNT